MEVTKWLLLFRVLNRGQKRLSSCTVFSKISTINFQFYGCSSIEVDGTNYGGEYLSE